MSSVTICLGGKACVVNRIDNIACSCQATGIACGAGDTACAGDWSGDGNNLVSAVNSGGYTIGCHINFIVGDIITCISCADSHTLTSSNLATLSINGVDVLTFRPSSSVHRYNVCAFINFGTAGRCSIT